LSNQKKETKKVESVKPKSKEGKKKKVVILLDSKKETKNVKVQVKSKKETKTVQDKSKPKLETKKVNDLKSKKKTKEIKKTKETEDKKLDKHLVFSNFIIKTGKFLKNYNKFINSDKKIHEAAEKKDKLQKVILKSNNKDKRLKDLSNDAKDHLEEKISLQKFKSKLATKKLKKLIKYITRAKKGKKVKKSLKVA